MKQKRFYEPPVVDVTALQMERIICESEQIESNFGMGTLNSDNDLSGLFEIPPFNIL